MQLPDPAGQPDRFGAGDRGGRGLGAGPPPADLTDLGRVGLLRASMPRSVPRSNAVRALTDRVDSAVIRSRAASSTLRASWSSPARTSASRSARLARTLRAALIASMVSFLSWPRSRFGRRCVHDPVAGLPAAWPAGRRSCRCPRTLTSTASRSPPVRRAIQAAARASPARLVGTRPGRAPSGAGLDHGVLVDLGVGIDPHHVPVVLGHVSGRRPRFCKHEHGDLFLPPVGACRRTGGRPWEVTTRHHCDGSPPPPWLDRLLIRPGGGQGDHRPTTRRTRLAKTPLGGGVNGAMSHNRRGGPASTLPVNLRPATPNTHSGASPVRDWSTPSWRAPPSPCEAPPRQ